MATETLPALLSRRFGIPERTTLAVAGAVVALGVLAFLVLRDPLEGKTQLVHRRAPVFNVLYTKGVVDPVKPRPGEFVRLEARRGPLRLEVTLRPVRLPAYQGDVSGLLPVYFEGHAQRLGRTLPGFEVIDEGKARVNDAPGYQVGFRYGTPQRPGTGRDVIVVPPEEPGIRDGVLISLRQQRGRRRPGERGRMVIAAVRSAFRSFRFGTGRR